MRITCTNRSAAGERVRSARCSRLICLPNGFLIGIQTMSSWLIIGAVTGVALWLAYTFVFRHHPQLLLVAVATIVILSSLREGLQRAFPSALLASIAGASLVAIAVWVWIRGSMSKSAV